MRNCVLLCCNLPYVQYANFVAWQLQLERQNGLEVVVCSDDPAVGGALLVGVRFVHLPDVKFFKSLNTVNRLGYHAYLRLPAIELVSREYDRVLYVDTDVFVSRKGLEQVFDLELHGAVIGAVRDGQQRVHLKRNVNEFKRMGLPSAPYFNSGVLLVDCAAWLKRGCYARLLEIARENPEVLATHDQSLLNLVFYQNWTELSPVWNWQSNSKMNLWGEYFGARLLHTVGGRTVWKDVGGRLPRRYTSEYRLYCMKLGLEPPNNDEDHWKLYRRFLVSIFLQLKEVFAVSKITGRFPQDDVTISHQPNE